VRARVALGASIVIVSLVCLACGGGGGSTSTAPSPSPTAPPGTTTPAPTPTPGGLPVLFVGAGDIGWCDDLSAAFQTGRMVNAFGAIAFTLGDNAYFEGSAKQYSDCYDPTWGAFKSRTFPAPGNHEYQSPGATPYYQYFGANAGTFGQGWYSYEAGDWHVISLNSNYRDGVAVSAGSAQAAWLTADLATHKNRCTLAYWHHPLFTSGPNRPNTDMRDIWRILYSNGVDVILNGHDHLYERFAPQDPDGRLDVVRGIRQFTVGTGGAALYDVVALSANSERVIKQYGIMKLTLSSDRYDWDFIPLAGAGDSGGLGCH
jgi:calcineurin-like phosphoesterase family protein